MRAIPDQFFAALFGVWLGLQTDIWKKSVDKILLLVGGLSVIAILFGTFSITNARKLNKNFRNAVGLMLGISVLISGRVLKEFGVIDRDLVVPFYILLFAWVGIGLLSDSLEKIIHKVRLDVLFRLRIAKDGEE